MNTCRYSVMSEEDLVEFINGNFLMNLKTKDLIEPTKDFVWNIYDKFLSDFGINYKVGNHRATSHIEHINMHSHSMPLVHMKVYLSKILSKAGFVDFSFADINKPQRRRFQIILSQLIGMWAKFFELKEAWQQKAEEQEKMARRNEDLQRKNEKMKQLLEEKLLECSRLKDEFPNPEGMLASAAEKLSLLKAKSGSLKAAHENLKLKKVKMREAQAELAERKACIKEKIGDLRAQMISSPEKVFTETQRKEKLLQELRNERSHLEQQVLEKRHSLNTLKEELENCKKMHAATDDFQLQQQNILSAVQKIQITDDEILEKERKNYQLDIQIAKTKEIFEDICKRKIQFSKSHDNRISTLKYMTKEIESEIANLSKEDEESDQSSAFELTKLQQQHATLEKELLEKKGKFEKTDQEERERFVKIASTISQFHCSYLNNCNGTS